VKYRMIEVRSGLRGHAKPVGASSLKPPAFAAMNGAAAHSFPRTGEARPGKGFRRSARMEPVGYARTGRNMTQATNIEAFQPNTAHLCDDIPEH